MMLNTNFWNDLTFGDMIYTSVDIDILHVIINIKLTLTHNFIFYTFETQGFI